MTNLSVIYKTQSTDRLGLLEESLKRCKRQTVGELETIVIGSWDVKQELDTVPNIDKCDYTYRSELTIARNMGVELASKDYVAFMDDDAYPSQQWAEYIFKGLRQADAAGGPIYPHKTTTTIPDFIPHSFYWLIGCGPFYEESKMVNNTYGSNLAMSKEAFLDVGGFDQNIGMGTNTPQGAETDLINRMRKAGYDCTYYHPEAIVRHHIGKKDIAMLQLMQRAMWQGSAKAKIGTGNRESSYVKEELLDFDSPKQAAMTAFFTALVGTGYCFGKIENVF